MGGGGARTVRRGHWLGRALAFDAAGLPLGALVRPPGPPSPLPDCHAPPRQPPGRGLKGRGGRAGPCGGLRGHIEPGAQRRMGPPAKTSPHPTFHASQHSYSDQTGRRGFDPAVAEGRAARPNGGKARWRHALHRDRRAVPHALGASIRRLCAREEGGAILSAVVEEPRYRRSRGTRQLAAQLSQRLAGARFLSGPSADLLEAPSPSLDGFRRDGSRSGPDGARFSAPPCRAWPAPGSPSPSPLRSCPAPANPAETTLPKWVRLQPARRVSFAAAATWVPSPIHTAFTEGELAVLSTIARTCQGSRDRSCTWPVARIAGVAGVCHRLAQMAVQKARRMGLILWQERPRRGARSDTNVIEIIDPAWYSHLETKARKNRKKLPKRAAIGCRNLHTTGDKSFLEVETDLCSSSTRLSGHLEASPGCASRLAMTPTLSSRGASPP